MAISWDGSCSEFVGPIIEILWILRSAIVGSSLDYYIHVKI